MQNINSDYESCLLRRNGVTKQRHNYASNLQHRVPRHTENKRTTAETGIPMSINVKSRGRTGNKSADNTGFHKRDREPTVKLLVTRSPTIRETDECNRLTLK